MGMFSQLAQGVDWSSLGAMARRVVVVLLCLVVHEVCHGLAAYWLGDPTAKRNHRLSLNPLRHLDPFGLLMMVVVGFVWAKPGNNNVSSCFILQREKDGVDERLCMGDCAIQIDPDEDALVETALECAKTAATFGIDPKIAFLSYSTKGSGKGEAVDKVRNACEKAKAAAPELAIDGEMQFDAAVSPVVGQQKFPGSKVAGHANTFIFPEIQSGNIGYKIAQRLGGFAAYGPILQGLNAPINDLSRGCDADEVYKMAIITAALA